MQQDLSVVSEIYIQTLFPNLDQLKWIKRAQFC